MRSFLRKFVLGGKSVRRWDVMYKRGLLMPPVIRAQLDYYAVLQLTPAADVAEVNAAFRRLAWRYHPDRSQLPGATLRFQDINEARQVLTDPVRRAEYDAKSHPKTGGRRRATQPLTRRHSHYHALRRRRRVKRFLTALFSLVFILIVWTVIFASTSSAHAESSDFSFAQSSPITKSDFCRSTPESHSASSTPGSDKFHHCDTK